MPLRSSVPRDTPSNDDKGHLHTDTSKFCDRSTSGGAISCDSCRVWDGHKHYPNNIELERVISDFLKPWIAVYWFRFFGKARTFDLHFGLSVKGQNNTEMVDHLTVEVSTKGKKRKRQHSTNDKIGLGMPLVEYKGIFKRKAYEDALKKMYDLLFLGNGSELESTCSRIFECFRDKSADLQIISQCYTVSAFCTHTNDIEKTRRIMKQAQQLLPHAQNRQLLEAKINSTIGYAYRKNGQLGTALSYLERAYQSMLLIKPCAFRGECLYHLSSLKFETLKGQTLPPQTVYQDILSDLDRVIDLMETESRMTMPVRQRIMIKKALILADRGTRCHDTHRIQELKQEQEQLQEAERLLHHVEFNEEFQSVSFQYIKCCLLQGKVAVFQAKQMFDKANEYAESALNSAKENGFTGELKRIQKVLGDLQIKSTIRMESIKPAIDVIEGCFSDPYMGDCSSETDDDLPSSLTIIYSPQRYQDDSSIIISDQDSCLSSDGNGGQICIRSHFDRHCSESYTNEPSSDTDLEGFSGSTFNFDDNDEMPYDDEYSGSESD